MLTLLLKGHGHASVSPGQKSRTKPDCYPYRTRYSRTKLSVNACVARINGLDINQASVFVVSIVYAEKSAEKQ